MFLREGPKKVKIVKIFKSTQRTHKNVLDSLDKEFGKVPRRKEKFGRFPYNKAYRD